MACRAAVAQLVEQRIRNAKVASSIPASGTSKYKHLALVTSRGFLLSGVRVGAVSILTRFVYPYKPNALIPLGYSDFTVS